MGRGERSLTASLARFFPSDPRRVPLGIGDDAAVIRHAGALGVVTCDPVVEGIHFRADTPLGLVGRKAVNRNLSDLAAMGASADHLLVSVLIPDRVDARARRALFVGIRRAAARAGCLVVGGDVARSPGPLVVTITAIGHPGAQVLTRSGARVGDAIHVTGPLGGSAHGDHHLRFTPRLDEGRWLAAQPAVRAAIDISDGFALDLWTLVRASGVPGAVVFEAALPIAAAARRAARADRRSALAHALADGEDHELIFVVGRRRQLAAGGPLRDAARTPVGVIGTRPGLWLRSGDGVETRLAAEGYQHDVR